MFFKMIEASGTFTVPATGNYKIICVAGGNGGGTSAGTGGATSFGTYCTASGQWGGGGNGGTGGYTLLSYGGAGGSICSSSAGIVAVPPVGNGGARGSSGIGYGAGGACSTADLNVNAVGTNPDCAGGGGAAGKLCMAIVSLTSGENITCTIGAGGTAGTSGTAGIGGVICVQEV